jgi:magnesium transporter
MPASVETFVALVRHPDGLVEELPPERLDEIDRLCAVDGTIVWVSVRSPTDAKIEVLEREFKLHPLAVEDLRKRRQRPKLDTYADQHMIVAYEARSDGADGGLAEIHVFVGPSWMLTVSWEATSMVDAVRAQFAAGKGRSTNTGGLLYAVLDAAVDSYFPVLDRVSDQIDGLEDRALQSDTDPAVLRDVLSIKRRLLNLRRVLAPMRDLANQLLRQEVDLVDQAAIPYYQDLYDHLVRVMDQLDLNRDLLATVHDTRLTVASNSLNAIMKRLTAFTVVLMVPTLIAGIYGMNFERMPELQWPLGYPLALGLMAIFAAIAVAVFRRRGWF